MTNLYHIHAANVKSCTKKSFSFSVIAMSNTVWVINFAKSRLYMCMHAQTTVHQHKCIFLVIHIAKNTSGCFSWSDCSNYIVYGITLLVRYTSLKVRLLVKEIHPLLLSERWCAKMCWKTELRLLSKGYYSTPFR